ncbi:prion protein b [Anabas testudineus]|uniref:Prion protein, related sequence 3 n=1 Tax=Anabas testudineus TaxID=64144 RepID=A0A3Q1J3I6_ANATE|nr:prion protein b [Anabas testudineus]
MKLIVIAVLSLPFFLVHVHVSLAKKKIKISEKIDLFKKKILDTKFKVKQPKQPGRPGSHPKPKQGGYPQQPGSPYGGGYGGYGGHGGYGGYGGYGGHGGYGGYGGHGGYPGGYINYNPNNKILSPHYGGSFGYGGHGVGGGSPFSHSVQAMGMYPSDKSRGFGSSAVMAAAGGAMAGMALGYGLGRFPRPHFHFNSPQEEYYYNNYMYRRYGVKSTDTNDYGRDYGYTKPPLTYDQYMQSCMRRADLLPAENRKSNYKPTVSMTTTNTTTAASDAGTSSNTTKTNSTVAESPSTPALVTPRPVNESDTNPQLPASQALRKGASDDDDDTVSIVEIGYPALIRDMKVRRCVELYMAYSEKYLKRQTGGAQTLVVGLRGLLAVVTSTTVMLLNSNILILLP